MIKVVLDTDVYISALVSSSGPCVRIMDWWLDGQIAVFSSSAIIDEIEKVVNYPGIAKRHGLNEEEIDQYIKFLKFFSMKTPMQTPMKTEDDDIKEEPIDNMFLSFAVEVEANFLISGDPHSYNLETYNDIKIVTPDRFSSLMENEM
jgi:uncharacterized protein